MSSSQMLKGILEGCLLAVIAEGETYGYEMIQKLAKHGFHMVSEGSIYPLLIRMQKEGLIKGELKVSPAGPQRKYYTLTSTGTLELEQFMFRWEELSGSVTRVLQHITKKE